jgi:F5/8 type C domain
MFRKAIDWILVTNAVREARARLAAENRRRGAQLQQARLVAEVMKRVAEPGEALPAGNRAAIILALAREAVTAILADPPAEPVATDGGPPGESMAPTVEPTAPPPSSEPAAVDARPLAPGATSPAAPAPGPERAAAVSLPLSEALDRTPPEVLLAAAPDVPTLGAIKEDLLASPTTVEVEASEREEQQAERVRAFVDGLLWNADAPRRRLDHLLVSRLIRLTLVAAVLLLVAFGGYKLVQGPNLAAGKPWKTSSHWSGCSADPTCEGVLLFHTVEEKEPWAELDLLKPHTIHRIEVKNRGEYGERTIPLVVEVSLDGKQWTEVGRKKEQFTTWTIKFPRRSVRYIKLHIARVSTLHIRDLVVQ